MTCVHIIKSKLQNNTVFVNVLLLTSAKLQGGVVMVGVLNDSETTGLSLKRLAGAVTPLFSQHATAFVIHASNSISRDHSRNMTSSFVGYFLKFIKHCYLRNDLTLVTIRQAFLA